MNLRTLAAGAALMVVAGTLSAQQMSTTAAPAAPSGDIIATLQAEGNFTTFLHALDVAGMTEQLKGPGPFTVFAPTDEAFSRIPQARRDSLLSDKAGLVAILNNHIVSGRLSAEEVSRGANGVGFLGGQSLKVDTTGGVRVNGASVVKANILASNGVIHAIDQVLLPGSDSQVKGTTPADSANREPKPKPNN
jgi:uncharacterized surface protein with fasciclin (FAS1) repeats